MENQLIISELTYFWAHYSTDLGLYPLLVWITVALQSVLKWANTESSKFFLRIVLDILVLFSFHIHLKSACPCLHKTLLLTGIVLNL